MSLSTELQNMVKTLIKYKIPRKNETLENVSDWVDYYINVEIQNELTPSTWIKKEI